ncbi:hypothetical protein [Demequina sediminicola]|uniref:hypothetical protein n=1 Tax=Demequina sediminicola TaxID=1095026 RepID=UPI0007823973|nr:hypothetical protein [Demequina sediminicola]
MTGADVGATPEAREPSGGTWSRWQRRLGAGRQADYRFETHRAVAVITVVFTAAVHAWVGWTARGPVIVPDETGTLGAAHVLAGVEPSWLLAGSGFMPGLAIFVTPAWWLTSDPWVIYYCALAVVWVFSVLAIWPLARIAAHFGAAPHASWVMAAVVSLAPGRALLGNYAMAESLLTFAIAATIAVALQLTQKMTPTWGAVLGAAAGFTFLAHGRGLAVVVAVVVWSLVVLWRKWNVLAATLLSACVSVGAAWALYQWIVGALYWNDMRASNTLRGVSAGVMEIVAITSGMAWYAVAAWPAVAVAGLIIVCLSLRRRPVSLLVLLAAAAVYGAAAVQLVFPAQTALRLDLFIYGRYVDPLLVILAVIGLASLVRLRSWAFSGAIVLVTATVLFGFHVLTLPHVPVGGQWFDVHIAGVSHYFSRFNYANSLREPWELLSLATLGLTICFVALARIRAFLIVALGSYFAVLTAADDVVRVDPWNERGSKSESVASVAATLDPQYPIAFDYDFGAAINIYTYALNPTPLHVVNLDEEAPGTPYLYSSVNAEVPARDGAVPLAVRDGVGLVLWVYPGPEQDRLNELGLLAERE